MKLERAAISRVCLDTGREWKTRGVRKALRFVADMIDEELEEEGEEGGPAWWLRTFRRLPDAYWLDKGGCALHFLEIENTSMLTESKLQALVNLWWGFDASTDWRLHLWVADRYGHHLRELDLFPYVLDACRERYPNERNPKRDME